jgi:NAD(P)-dependent dehydrogenase (short-subunit alcohol dehydrogenase family)
MNYLDKFRLDKKITLVTGGAGGIGMEICKALLDAKSIVILADIDEKKSNKFIKSLKKNKNKIIFFKLDATSEKNINDLKKFIYKKFKKLDILINAIGICKNKDATKVSKSEWDEVININLNSMFYLCKEFGKMFIKQKKGNIINIGSNSGLIVDRPQPQASYNASKAAVHQLTKSLACEWAPYRIRVNAIAPGYVATEMTLLGRNKPHWFKYWIDMTPMKRLAKPEEIASAVLFLASDSSSYCTGSILSVDGGYTSW